MLGGCRCKNITFDWHIRDFSLVPRACQCNYCVSKNAAYVAKPGSKFSLTIMHAKIHHQHTQGSRSATFHECRLCHELVAVTCTIDGQNYGVINANVLAQRKRFPNAKAVQFTVKPKILADRLQQRKLNWSSPVTIKICGDTLDSK